MKEVKRRIRTTVFEATVANVIEIERCFAFSGKNSVIDEAANFIKKIENGMTQKIVDEILLKMKDNSRKHFSPTLAIGTFGILERLSEKFKLSYGEAMDLVVALYKNEREVMPDKILEKKRNSEPIKENFSLQSLKAEILFVLYVKYPEYVSYSEFLDLINKIELDNNILKSSEEEIRRELKNCVKNSYIHNTNRGPSIKYILLDSGLSYLIKTSVQDFTALFSRVSDQDPEKMIEYGERLLREKKNNTVTDAWSYFSKSISSKIKKEYIKNSKKTSSLSDKEIALITAKLLEAIISKNMFFAEDDKPLNNEEKKEIRKKIVQFERNVIKKS